MYKPCWGLFFFFFFFDNQLVFCEAPSPILQSLLKGKVFSSYKGMLGRLIRCLWPGRTRRNKVAHHLLLQHLPEPITPSVGSTGQEHKLFFIDIIPDCWSSTVQFDFGHTDKVIETWRQKTNYLWNHLAPCKTPGPQAWVCPTT